MGELIDDLLQLARVSRAPLCRERLDLSGLARFVADDLRGRDPDRQVLVHVEDGLQVEADGRLIRIVLENLLGNAWKFSSKTKDAHIEFGKTDGENGPAFFVRDNGAGFDMAHATTLFRAFQRLHLEEDFSGTGIGSATVPRIMERHGGKVWAQSTLGAGATFFFAMR